MKEDISFYVVTLNQLIAELNKVTRTTFQQDIDEIVRVSMAIKSNADLLKKRAEHERAH